MKAKKKNLKNPATWKKALFYLLVHGEFKSDIKSQNKFISDIKGIASDVEHLYHSFFPPDEIGKATNRHPNFSLKELREEIISMMKLLIFEKIEIPDKISSIMAAPAPEINEHISKIINQNFSQNPRRIIYDHSSPFNDPQWYEISSDRTIVEECYDSFVDFLLNSVDVWKSMKLCEMCYIPFIPRTENHRFCKKKCRDTYHNKNRKFRLDSEKIRRATMSYLKEMRVDDK